MKRIFIGIVLLLLLVLLFLMSKEVKERKEKAEEKEGEPSLETLLKIALQPVGTTMYVWGGGWNEEDTGAGREARTLGLSPLWKEFAKKQDASYDYNHTRYEIHQGLDCSGYIGWVVYNLLEKENGKEGYVTKAADMAKKLSEKGLGSYVEKEDVTDWQPGDIMSMKDHVWMVVGQCQDGSVVLVHASPPGVTLAGTKLKGKDQSMAETLAKKYMSAYYPAWFEKYPDISCSYDYLESSHAMRWSPRVLKDGVGLKYKKAEEILSYLFEE